MDYEKLGAEIGRLVKEKNVAYGSSFSKSGDIMRILYPTGIPPEKMDDALTVVRILDKLFRVATSKDAFGESPFKDICGYSLLAAAQSEAGKQPVHDLLKMQEKVDAAAEADRLKLLGRLGISGTKYPCLAIGEDFRGNPEPDKPCVLERGHGSWHEDRMGDQWWSGPADGDP